MGYKLDSLYVTRTYAGFMEGTYEEANRSLRRSIPARIRQLWGDDRPVHIFWPEVDPESKTKRWPEYTYYAWLDGKAESVEDDGTHLFVVWFSTEPVNEVQYDLDELVTEEIWKKHAEGYGF